MLISSLPKMNLLLLTFTLSLTCSTRPGFVTDAEQVWLDQNEAPPPPPPVVGLRSKQQQLKPTPTTAPVPKPQPAAQSLPVPLKYICKKKKVKHNCKLFECGVFCDDRHVVAIADIPCTLDDGTPERRTRCCKCYPQGSTIINIYNNTIEQCGTNGCTTGDD